MTTNKVVMILLFTLFASCSAIKGSAAIATADPSIVMTERGPIRGTITPILRKFLGVPYAAPPVGKLRWRPPKAHDLWFAPLNATKFSSHCPQDPSFFGVASTTEDCLFLNIITPNEEATKGDGSHSYPVIVWIHGGALIVGESDDYVPTKLVQQGDVIVVTINYRLGALGFLAHPALTAESPDHVSGNYGIMDQQFALRWVRRNIAAFGGNPHNVTIFGESAGGFSVLSNLTSPTAAGLFHQAIVESGAYMLALPTLADAESQGTAFANSVGCTDQTVECLRSTSVERVLANQGDVSPNADGKVLPLSLDTAFATGQFHHVPVMQGTNHDEMRLFVALDELGGHPLTAEEYPLVVSGFVGPEVAPLVLAEYPLNKFDSPALALGALETDTIFACSARGIDQVLGTQVPTFVYEFNDSTAPEIYLPPVSFPYGAAHASELQYLFKLPQSVQLSADQHRLSGNMIHYWTQFARSGDPNAFGTSFWPPYSPAIDDFESLSLPSPVGESGFATDHHCDFWAELFGTGAQRAARISK